MVFTHPLMTKYFCPLTDPFMAVARVPIIIDIAITLIFHRFFQFSIKV